MNQLLDLFQIRSVLRAQMIAALALGSVSLSAGTFSIPANPADNQVNSLGTPWGNVAGAEVRVGQGEPSGNYLSVHVMPFQLPQLPQGEEVTAATLSFNLVGWNNWNSPLAGVDLYGLTATSVSPTVTGAHYVDGPNPAAGAVLLTDDILTPADVNTSAASGQTIPKTSTDFAAFIQGLYDNGAQAGDYVFLVLAHESVLNIQRYYTISSANSAYPVPTLDVTTAAVQPTTRTVVQPIEGNDCAIDAAGGLKWNGQGDARVGNGYGASLASVYVLPVELPVLQQGEYIVSATLDVNLQGWLSWGSTELQNVDVYGLGLTSASSTVQASYYVNTANPSGYNATLLSDNLVIPGDVTSNAESALTIAKTTGDMGGFFQGLYDAGAQAGQYAFLVLGHDNVATIQRYYIFSSANSTAYPAPAVTFTIGSGTASGPQLFNLPDQPSTDRFALPADRVWPANVGEADICLWNDDKFCAISLTIDDNNANDWAWWQQVASQYGLPLTWFLITDNVGASTNGGTWSGAQALADAGHSIQSHSVTHGPSPTDADYIYEYAHSQSEINAHITGQWCGTLAYPGGTGTGPRPDLAKDYYIAARGTTGTPNKANRTWYLNTNSVSGHIEADYIDSIVYGTSGVSWLGNNQYRRGWLSVHFHSVPSTSRAQRESELAYIDSLSSEIWLGTFYDVARYGQQRDTATLTVESVGTSDITFTLVDEMDDSIYDLPLTVKIRVPNTWMGVSATQGGTTLDASIVDNAGQRYALVKAVPDQGLVTVSDAPNLTAYYVDPVNGSMSNPGTYSQPWSTLQAVFAAGKTFSTGDVIYLRSGYHGLPEITGNNSGNVTIQAQEGHSPTAREVHFSNAANWTLSGLTVSPELAGSYTTSYSQSIVCVDGGCSSITIKDCTIYSASDLAGWTATDVNTLFNSGITNHAPDSLIEGNHVFNVWFGIINAWDAPNSVIRDNLLQGIREDGIRPLADYVTVEYNTIVDFYGIDDKHDDGIQSYTGGHSGIPVGTVTLYGCIIRGNVIIDSTDPTRPFQPSYGTQGIACFDGFYDGWLVENNLVVIDMWHGIALLGAVGCKVVNNTVIQNPNHPSNRVPWVTVRNHKDGRPSSGNIVRNNLASTISTLAGTTASNNIATNSPTSHFVNYAGLDFHLLSTSTAVNAGTTADAPSIDLETSPRTAPYDVGAFEF